MATVADRALSWSVAMWGPAACAALVVAGLVAPWATNGEIAVSGLRGTGFVTIALGLLALTAALAWAQSPTGGRGFGWPMLVCFGFAALLGGHDWIVPQRFTSDALGDYARWAREMRPGPGVKIVVAAGVAGAAWSAVGLAFRTARGADAVDAGERAIVSRLVDRWALVCLASCAVLLAADGLGRWFQVETFVPSRVSGVLAVGIGSISGLAMVTRAGAWSRRPALTVACFELLALLGLSLWRLLDLGDALRLSLPRRSCLIPEDIFCPPTTASRVIIVALAAVVVAACGWVGAKIAWAIAPAELTREESPIGLGGAATNGGRARG